MKCKKTVEFDLPWPPTLNTYYRRHTIGRKIFTSLSKGARIYKKQVEYIVVKECLKLGIDQPFEIEFYAFPPDNRKRDVDNLLKAPMDAMESAGVFKNDSLCWSLKIKKYNYVKAGLLKVVIHYD